jgi:hypothetical protein
VFFEGDMKMNDPNLPRASRITFEEVTEAALGGVLRALEVHRKNLQASDKLIFKNPPIIYGIWIMPEELDFQNIKDVTSNIGRGG